MPIVSAQEAREKAMQYEMDNNLPHTPIIFVTVNALKGDKEKFLEAGMNAYVSTSIENVKMEEILSKFIPQQGKT